LDTLSYPELIEWAAYYELEPFGDVRADYQSGMVSSVIANVNQDKRVYLPSDFMYKQPDEQPTEVNQDWHSIFSVIKERVGVGGK
jgi:hypothetical protein